MILYRIRQSTLLLLLFLSAIPVMSQRKSDAVIVGHVTCKGDHIPFATISVKGTTIGTATDQTGHYTLVNVPTGTLTIIARAIGYKTQNSVININKNETKEIKFELEEDVLELEQVVITADRNNMKKKDASIVVTALTPKLFNSTESNTISEGLNFVPGLRIENNCQNCGFNQLRMIGLEGPYSQILINGRSIFSGLAGVYGLELVPTNMIERIEVIRGGGSALYGSNAIAGTVNLILKDPVYDSYELGISNGFTGIGLEGSAEPAYDMNIKLNTSLVSADNKTGMSFYGFYRMKEPFDANNDSFSELPEISNTTIGTRFYHRFGYRNKLITDFFHINEKRRGGDKFNYPVHEAGIAEAINHNISTAALTYDHFIRETDLLSVFLSGQYINRDSYYGANQSLSDYGNTNNFSYNTGINYESNFKNSSLVLGFDWKGETIKDVKQGYPDISNANIINDTIISIPHVPNAIIADQNIEVAGLFFQYEYTINKFKLSAGLRYDHYSIFDAITSSENTTGNVFSPRFNVLYKLNNSMQLRASYSEGYRAPQIFDEDLHIETSGSRRIIYKNDPDLQQESSRSYLASFNFNSNLSNVNFDFLVEGFYTQLVNPFVTNIGTPDENGTVIYTRSNAEQGSNVSGVNMELNIVPGRSFLISSGFTIQKSQYLEPQDFDETSYLRTPGNYGFLTMDWELIRNLQLSANATYTGIMLVPYFGPEAQDQEKGELRSSENFFDLGSKISKNIKLNGTTLQMYLGIKNIFNSYQSDFDTGINRDPGYIYGPVSPRTIYFGIKIGNSILNRSVSKNWIEQEIDQDLRPRGQRWRRNNRKHRGPGKNDK